MTYADDLRAWAKAYTTETRHGNAAEGLRWALRRTENAWVYSSNSPEGPHQVRAWINFAALPEEAGALSGGERRFMMVAASLAEDVPVVLGDVVPGLDRVNLELVLAAIAPAAGSHQHSGMTFDDDGNPKSFTHLTTLYPGQKSRLSEATGAGCQFYSPGRRPRM